MGDCPNLEKCPFFNDRLARMPSFTEWMKDNFCRRRYETCARYMVAKSLGSEYVPISLFPVQKERALEIIDRAG